MHTTSRNVALLMGPTSSGKTAMALAIADARPTVIINADAMQMVADLRIITARPTVEEEAQAEHALYGVLRAQEPTSVAVWLALVEPVIRAAWEAGKLPLLVGGTGMYLKTLMEGLTVVPEIPAEIRMRYRQMLHELLHPTLVEKDPVMAAKLKPGDTQRLIRALEVIDTTGQSLDVWQQQTTAPVFPDATYDSYYLDVPREELYARIDRRFGAMLAQGAVYEVKQLLERELHPDTPILRAHGVPELAAYLSHRMSLADATAKAQQNTRNYAKRQMTWIRNQMAGARAIKPQDNPRDFLKL